MKRLSSSWHRLLGVAFAAIDLVVPKDDRLVLFARDRFSDNSRALFEHIVATPSGLRAAWVVRSAADRSAIRRLHPDATVVLAFSWAGLWTALRARTVTLSNSLDEILPFSAKSGRKTVVVLWHAISIKKSKLLNDNTTARTTRRYRRQSRRYSAMIASADIDRCVKAATHGIDAGRVFVTGLPRSDTLLLGGARGAAFGGEVGRALGARTILYAPTWREYGAVTEFFPFADFDPVALNGFLESADAYILYRPHKADHRNLSRARDWEQAGLNRLVAATVDVVADVADLLGDVDVLVTDYSSIFLDTLAVEMPCVFIPYDAADYDERRGLLYDYDAITPGPKVTSQAAFVAALRDALAGAPEFAAQRGQLKKLFHRFDDGGACERTAAIVRRLAGVALPNTGR